MAEEDQVGKEKIRAAFFIDGFNLYHAIADLQQPHLKWISYWELANVLIPKQSQKLVGVTWCTARRSVLNDKARRHDELTMAQKISGVIVKKGHFVNEMRNCKNCNNNWNHPSEKEGDINVAIHLIRDAFKNVYDHAYLLTADSDQLATIRMFKADFPNKEITVIVPPGRPRSEALHNAAGKKSIQINTTHLEKSVMPPVVFLPGTGRAQRPTTYAPPAGWVHPNNRPK